MGAQTSRRPSDELETAAREGRVDKVSQLSTYYTGNVYLMGEALYLACEYGRLNVVTWLVEHTVVRDDGRWLRRALKEACKLGRWNIVKWLVNNTQVDVSKAHFRGDNNIIHWVISYDADKSLFISSWSDGMIELCRLVYVCGEDVNVQDNYNGDTPLHDACIGGSSDSVGALLLAGADETITNDRGWTPVQYVRWAILRNRVKVLRLLDVSSKWKLLVRSHRLRRRTAVRVMMTLVKWKVQQTRSMWTRAIMTLHTIITLVSHEDCNCCWLNIRDCMFAVACCYNTRSYSRIELRTI